MNDMQVKLVETLSVDGRSVSIYVDENGKVKANITENDGTITQAFFVKGMAARIDCSNADRLQWLKNVLEHECYIKVFAGDVFIHLRLKGGAPEKENLFAFTLLQVSIGTLFALSTTPAAPFVAPVLAGSLLASAWRTFMYEYNTSNADLNYQDFAKEVFIGAAGGAVSGGVGHAISAVGFLAEMGAGAICGVAQKGTETVAKKVVYPHKPLDLTCNDVMQAAGQGALLNGVKSIGKRAYSSLTSGEAPTSAYSSSSGETLNQFSETSLHNRAGVINKRSVIPTFFKSRAATATKGNTGSTANLSSRSEHSGKQSQPKIARHS